MNKAKARYSELLKKYCLPDFKGQAIAFGSESNHELGKEVIISDEVSKDTAIVRTKHKNENGFVADYEYRLIKRSSKWYLTAVDYVDKDGKYPSL